MRKLHHQSYLVKTTAGAVYQRTRKHLREMQVSKPDLDPPSADLDVSTKAQPHVHAPLKPVPNHAPAAAPQPKSAATQCTIQVHNHIAHMLSAALKQCKPALKQRFQHHPVCQLPRFLLVLLVTPQWHLADQATPTVPQNA